MTALHEKYIARCQILQKHKPIKNALAGGQ